MSDSLSSSVPQRIVCLNAECVDFLWAIGAWDHVAGITAYARPPKEAPKKPVVSGFNVMNLDKILPLQPDLVITHSDVQAPLAAELIKAGLTVLATNQRSLDEIFSTMMLLGRVMDRPMEAKQVLKNFQEALSPVPPQSRRPIVYFEEWPEPIVTGIGWVCELIERAGGENAFDFRTRKGAAQRTVTAEEILQRRPDVIVASWCGKPVEKSVITSRPGWDTLPAIQNGRVHEIISRDILQPGLSLAQGFQQLKELLK